jgi:hypothetical protein
VERERERDKEQRKLYLASLLAMEESLACFTCFTFFASTKVLTFVLVKQVCFTSTCVRALLVQTYLLYSYKSTCFTRAKVLALLVQKCKY